MGQGGGGGGSPLISFVPWNQGCWGSYRGRERAGVRMWLVQSREATVACSQTTRSKSQQCPGLLYALRVTTRRSGPHSAKRLDLAIKNTSTGRQYDLVLNNLLTAAPSHWWPE